MDKTSSDSKKPEILLYTKHTLWDNYKEKRDS